MYAYIAYHLPIPMKPPPSWKFPFLIDVVELYFLIF